MRNKTAGFSVIEVLVVVAIVALIGFIGFRVWQANNDMSLQTPPASESTSNTEAQPIKNESDLKNADKALDATKIDDGSSAELDSEVTY